MIADFGGNQKPNEEQINNEIFTEIKHSAAFSYQQTKLSQTNNQKTKFMSTSIVS